MAGHLAKPLLPDHPPLLSRQNHGERTVYESPELPAGMERAGGQWSLSDFTLTKQLYKGKASTLYQATDKVSGQVVALKTYSKRRLSDLNWYQVEREIRLHGQLRHPNIIQLHSAFEDDTHIFMVCEFATGGDLYEDLKRAGGQLKERVVAGEVLPPFMDALAHMHACSIIHRDIKPENILLGGDRAIKVADFGLSINWGEERPVTRAGTLDYMSPEVLQCPEKSRPEENKERLELGYSDAVDVWAVGILAYELLVGKPPFEKETREETYAYIQKQEPQLPDAVSQAAHDFILTALAKNPRKRPRMAELLRHPWIAQYNRRPSTRSPTRTSEFHLPLHVLPSPALQDVHRPSLHGAKSVRDFSTLLLTPSMTLHKLAGALHPTLGIAANLASTASTAVFDASATMRPTTTHSRLGHAATIRPGTPGTDVLAFLPEAAELEAALPAPAFPAVGMEGGTLACTGGEATSSGEQMQAMDADCLPWPATLSVSGMGRSGSAATILRLPTSTAGVAHDASFASALSSTGMETGSPSLSFTTTASIKLHTSSYNLQQTSMSTPSAGEQQSAFLELYKSMAPSQTASGSAPGAAAAHSPRIPPLGHKVGGSRSGTTPSSSNKNVDAALPLLQQQQQQQQQYEASSTVPPSGSVARLPSLRKVLPHIGEPSQLIAESLPNADAAVQATSQAPGAAALGAAGAVEAAGIGAAAAVATGREAEYAALAPIIEQSSGEAGSPMSSQANGGGHHLVVPMATHKKQQLVEVHEAAADATAAAAEPKIQAVHAASAARLASLSADAEHRRWQQHSQELGSELSMQTAQQAHHNRMREAEQKHVEKLRARLAAATLPPGRPPPPRPQPRRPASSYSAGIAKSASSLLNKLLGRKPASTAGQEDMAGAASRAVQRSAGPGSATTQGAAAAEQASMKPAKHHLSPPPVHIAVRAGGSAGQLMSPRQLPGEPHRSGNSLTCQMQHAASKAPSGSSPVGSTAPSTITLRSPARRAVPGRAVAASRKPAAASVEAEASQQGRCASLPAASGSGAASGVDGVEYSSNSKSVRFAGLGRAGSNGNLDERGFNDLIPAFHSRSASLSFTSAVSSLPSLTSASGTTRITPRASRKGSLSPTASRKSSHLVAAEPSQSSIGRPAGSTGLSGGTKARSSKMCSMPGDAGSGAAASAAALQDERSSVEADAAEVQRSAASWSHPAAGRNGSPSSTQRKSSASAARLSMYRQMLGVGGRTSHGHGHESRSPGGTQHHS